jgi:hypothetical protein
MELACAWRVSGARCAQTANGCAALLLVLRWRGQNQVCYRFTACELRPGRAPRRLHDRPSLSTSTSYMANSDWFEAPELPRYYHIHLKR